MQVAKHQYCPTPLSLALLDPRKKTGAMQVLNTMLVMCVFLMAVAVSEGFSRMGYSMNNRPYSMMNRQPYSMMNRQSYSMMNNQYYNRGYSNSMHQGNGDSDTSYMNYLPFLMDGEQGKQLATYNFLRNPNRPSSYLPYMSYMGGMENAWPIMAYASRGFNPFMMITANDYMN